MMRRARRNEAPTGAEDDFEPVAEIDRASIDVGELVVRGHPCPVGRKTRSLRENARIDRPELRDRNPLGRRHRQRPGSAAAGLGLQPQSECLGRIIAPPEPTLVMNVTHPQRMAGGRPCSKKPADPADLDANRRCT